MLKLSFTFLLIFELIISLSGISSAEPLSEGNVTPVTTTPNTTTNTTTTTTTTTSTTTTTTTTPITPIPLVPLYQVKDHDGKNICLLAQMNLKFSIRYYTTVGIPATAHFFINSSSNVHPKVEGECGNKSQTLLLNWWPDFKDFTPAWRLLMQFNKMPSGHFSLNLVEFNFTVTNALFPDTNETSFQFMVRNDSQFTCPLGSYFQCLSEQTSKLNKFIPNASPVEVFFTVTDLKVEAFRTNPDPLFVGTMSECSSDYVPNKVVPIVVGVALACMIVIALVAFIVSSRRRQNGYQTI